MATCTSAPSSNNAETKDAETSAKPPAFADMRCAMFPMPDGKYVISGVTMRILGLACLRLSDIGGIF